MKRITISLPDELAARVEREARQDRTSISQVVRQSLTAKFGPVPEDGKRPVPIAGLFASGYTDTAERHDEILAETYDRRHADRQAQPHDRARDR